MALFLLPGLIAEICYIHVLKRGCINGHKASSASASFFTGTTSIPSIGCLGALA